MAKTERWSSGRIETISVSPPSQELHIPSTWWEKYSESLASQSLTETTQRVLEVDSRYITDFGVLGGGTPGSASWPNTRVRRGVVMGAVQSGKTASMLGVTALSLDAKVDMVVVLAGTRVTLWRQTFERLLSQLDRRDGVSSAERARSRLLVPDPQLALDDGVFASPAQLYAMQGPRLQHTIESGAPILVVAMKNVHHLRALRDVIDSRLIPIIKQLGRPFHLIVLDDEADDGSILDAGVEASRNPEIDDLKQIPRSIVDLWEDRPHQGDTKSSNLYVTYVGYTATPQANFLQSDHNPLSPREFAVVLRTPFDSGDFETRSTTFSEPQGLKAFYTGGETYYNLLGGELCYSTSNDPDWDLAEALRAYFVAGAIRRLRDPNRLSAREALTTVFNSREDVIARCPKPHTMLFHPSATITDHFEAAANILQVACGFEESMSRELIDGGDRGLPVDAFQSMMDSEESLWINWLGRFQASAERVRDVFNLTASPLVPDESQWSSVRAIILEDVVPATRIKIINSDPSADDRPKFDPLEVERGRWSAPSDLTTIFVSGNVMSRGLTLEGLTTTLFLRGSENPFADTQMQMQRWFGYRGTYLDTCRVVLPEQQFGLFRAYHDADEALRRAIVDEMNKQRDRAPSPTVVQGQDFTATGKLTNLSNVPLCPGATPFVKLINVGPNPDPNLEVVARVFRAAPSEDIVAAGRLRGRILSNPLSLLDAANLLDELRYEVLRPTLDGWEGRRWQDLEAMIGITSDSDPDGVLPFFRPPPADNGSATPNSRSGPYAISAYLRLWKACLTRLALTPFGRHLVRRDVQNGKYASGVHPGI